MVAKAYAECDDLIARAKKGLLENKPGCNQEQTLEAMISSVLSNVRDKVGEICMMELSRHNAPLIMATCGSKGMYFTFLIKACITDYGFRFRHQRLADGGLCRSTNHCGASCPRWLPRSFAPSLPQEITRAAVERFRPKQFLHRPFSHRVFVPRYFWSRRSGRYRCQDSRNRLHATSPYEGFGRFGYALRFFRKKRCWGCCTIPIW